MKSARIFGLLPISTINRQSSVQSNKPKILSTQIQKTSIKINSGECLSRVTVNQREKYQSSVTIRDNLSIMDYQKLFDYKYRQENKSLPFESLELKNDANILLKEMMKSKEVCELISTNEDKTTTLICLNHKPSSDSVEKNISIQEPLECKTSNNKSDSVILKLMNDPYLGNLFHGLEVKTMANIIKNLLTNLSENKTDSSVTELNNDDENLVFKRLKDVVRDEKYRLEPNLTVSATIVNSIPAPKRKSFVSDEFIVNVADEKSDYSSILESNDKRLTRSLKNHEYESINFDPIYEEINDIPPPLPKSPPPSKNIIFDKHYKPMFLGATKNEILSYLVDAKDRINVPEESYTFKFLRRSSEDTMISEKINENNKNFNKLPIIKCGASIERNDSGVGSETSKTSRTKYQSTAVENTLLPINLCEDCGMKILCHFVYSVLV